MKNRIINESVFWVLLQNKDGKRKKLHFKKWTTIKELLAWAFQHGLKYIETGLYDFGGVGGYFTDLKGNKFEPERIKEIKMRKSELKKIIKEVLSESRFPPKAMDYNKLPNADEFWKWEMSEAARQSGLKPLPVKEIGDLIFWLNMAGMRWEELDKKTK